MAAAGAVSGTRAWLNHHGFLWLTPRRAKYLTVALSVAAVVASSVTLSGSTPAPRAPAAAHSVR
jgi:hypothetical protein